MEIYTHARDQGRIMRAITSVVPTSLLQPRRLKFLIVTASALMLISLVSLYPGNENIQPTNPSMNAVDALKKVAAPPKKGAPPAAAPACLQWLAGSCIAWDGTPPPGATAGQPPPGPQPGNPYEAPPQPHIIMKAPCNASECCRHFYPGNKDVGLGSMYDPRCTLEYPPHPNCIPSFACSYCCKTPLNGACPMKDRTCNSLKDKEIKKILKEFEKKNKTEEAKKKHQRQDNIHGDKEARDQTSRAKKAEETVKVKAKAEGQSHQGKGRSGRDAQEKSVVASDDFPGTNITQKIEKVLGFDRPSAKPLPKIQYRAPCNSTDCCKHFFPGNDNVGLSSMYDPKCVVQLPPHQDCIEFFMCSYCCKKPMDGACPMKGRPCEELSKSAVKQIFDKAEKQKEEEKEAEEKANAASNVPTPAPTSPKPTPHYTAPCTNDRCCENFWPGSQYDKVCEPGGIGHQGCVGGYACIYHMHAHATSGRSKQAMREDEAYDLSGFNVGNAIRNQENTFMTNVVEEDNEISRSMRQSQEASQSRELAQEMEEQKQRAEELMREVAESRQHLQG
eukprot:CAMPEP_0114505422 /NCGR_PEP_ID=MMETSP0109-20121206/10845_1 /TAXON_ID=29199 /ORGANISM="Chlorarachnion reptans, Strain CCCM449" /LENGTH=559 /DNA_ID=CAMNT_0001683861 /DNA_START=401 /DNA_END=2080 /DNA_ORIENTATION=+